MQAIVLLAPCLNMDGAYEMGYDDGNLLTSVLEWKRRRESRDTGAETLISVIAVGGREAKSVVRESLAMGADRGLLLIREESFDDGWRMARYLCRAIWELGAFSLLCAGGESPQWEAFAMAAEMLGLPQVTQTLEFEERDDGLLVKRDGTAGTEYIRVSQPCFLSNGWSRQTSATLTYMDIQSSMEKELEIREATDGCEATTAKTEVLALAVQKRARRNQIGRREDEIAAVHREIQRKLAFVIHGG